MFSNTSQIVNTLCYIDAICRQELHEGYLVSERDYVSAFCTHLRYPLGPLSRKLLGGEPELPLLKSFPKVMGMTTSSRVEQHFGCDGAILIGGKHPDTGEPTYKLGMFEAKWPRLHGGNNPYKICKNYPWDKTKRFSRQLEAQKNLLAHGIAVWEQFFCEEESKKDCTNETGMLDTGSTCVWHSEAVNFMNKEKLADKKWTPTLLKKLLKDEKNRHSFRDILTAICSCQAGTLITPRYPANTQLQFDNLSAESKSGITYDLTPVLNEIPSINPVPIFQSADNIPSVREFMSRVGLSMYCFIDMREFNLPEILDEL